MLSNGSMSFSQSLIVQVVRYKQAMGLDVTYEQIRDQPWGETVQSWWESKAYFREPGFYTRLESVPEEYIEDQVRIVDKKGLHFYVRINGEWKKDQSVTKDLYKR